MLASTPVREMLKDALFDVTEDELVRILDRVKEIGDQGRRVTDVDLYAIAEAITNEVLKPTILLEELSVMTGIASLQQQR